MDDAADGVYSRAPELEDLLKLCAALNREAVRYLLIGGFARAPRPPFSMGDCPLVQEHRAS